MTTFKIKIPDDSIEWSMSLNTMGGLIISANDVDVLYVNEQIPTLIRLQVSSQYEREVSLLPFNKKGYWALEEEEELS